MKYIYELKPEERRALELKHGKARVDLFDKWSMMTADGKFIPTNETFEKMLEKLEELNEKTNCLA
jgi:hypothetical protein